LKIIPYKDLPEELKENFDIEEGEFLKVATKNGKITFEVINK
jgi:hypothetical protein